jgi:hypothetical protein
VVTRLELGDLDRGIAQVEALAAVGAPRCHGLIRRARAIRHPRLRRSRSCARAFVPDRSRAIPLLR